MLESFNVNSWEWTGCLFFFTLSAGYLLGRLRLGKFRLGTLCGTILASFVLGFAALECFPGLMKPATFNSIKLLQNLGFLIFIYVVGYESGPFLNRLFDRRLLREVLLSLAMTAAALGVIFAVTYVTLLMKNAGAFSKETAVQLPGILMGSAAGGLTQAAMFNAGLGNFNVVVQNQEVIRSFNSCVALAFAFSYLFGLFAVLFGCTKVVPYLCRKTDAALDSAREGLEKKSKDAATFRLSKPVGRAFRLRGDLTASVEELNAEAENKISIEAIYRDGAFLADIFSETLKKDDIVIITGERAAVSAKGTQFGVEQPDFAPEEFELQLVSGILTKRRFNGITLDDFRRIISEECVKGLYIESIWRGQHRLPLSGELVLQRGDVITFFDSKEDALKAVRYFGCSASAGKSTDLQVPAIGISCGILLSLVTVSVFSMFTLKLDNCITVMLIGVLTGYWHSRHPSFGNIPPAAAQLCKDFGLSAFLVGLGLKTVENGLSVSLPLFLLCAVYATVISLVPVVVLALLGKRFWKHETSNVFAATLAGARTSNPAFASIELKSRNKQIVIPFAVTYAISSITLALLGPATVSLLNTLGLLS